jgi:hypothetical protein
VAVKAPGFGENRKANLQDIAVLTGEGGGWSEAGALCTAGVSGGQGRQWAREELRPAHTLRLTLTADPRHSPPAPPPPKKGGEVVSEDLGHKLDKVEVSMLGSCKKVRGGYWGWGAVGRWGGPGASKGGPIGPVAGPASGGSWRVLFHTRCSHPLNTPATPPHPRR